MLLRFPKYGHEELSSASMSMLRVAEQLACLYNRLAVESDVVYVVTGVRTVEGADWKYSRIISVRLTKEAAEDDAKYARKYDTYSFVSVEEEHIVPDKIRCPWDTVKEFQESISAIQVEELVESLQGHVNRSMELSKILIDTRDKRPDAVPVDRSVLAFVIESLDDLKIYEGESYTTGASNEFKKEHSRTWKAIQWVLENCFPGGIKVREHTLVKEITTRLPFNYWQARNLLWQMVDSGHLLAKPSDEQAPVYWPEIR